MTPKEIIEICDLYGSSQALADAIEVSVRTVEGWRCGTSTPKPPVQLLLKIYKEIKQNERIERISTNTTKHPN